MRERRDITGLVRPNFLFKSTPLYLKEVTSIIVTDGAKMLVDLFVCQAFVIAYECATYT